VARARQRDRVRRVGMLMSGFAPLSCTHFRVSEPAITLGMTLMQIYWSLKSIPELSGLPSEERRRLWHAALWKTTRHWQVWAATFVILFITAMAQTMAQKLLIGMGYRFGQGIGYAIGGGVGWAIYWQVLSHFARPYLRELLSEKEPHEYTA
jgi:hypothetical protein